MGMLAEYMMVDEVILDSLMELNCDDLTEAIIALEESGKAERMGIEKIWDGLHFLLTGTSASTPIDGNKLSEAVVGVHVFNPDDEDADFITCTEYDELPEIVAALKAVDFASLKNKFDIAEFKRNKLYPNIWVEKDREQLFAEMENACKSITAFYESAINKEQHIIVSIL